jgi:hypothetical protein
MQDDILISFNYDGIPTMVPMELAVLLGLASAIIIFWAWFFVHKANKRKSQEAYTPTIIKAFSLVLPFIFLLVFATSPNPSVTKERFNSLATSELKQAGYVLNEDQLSELYHQGKSEKGSSGHHGSTDLGDDGLLICQWLTKGKMGGNHVYRIQHVDNEDEIKEALKQE